ncbi:ABC transporter permease [Nakamurella silvestris]|nr:ABC transporter permease [Nakamurella silvestris]
MTTALAARRPKMHLSTTQVVLVALAALVVVLTVWYAIRGQNFFSFNNLADVLTRSSLLGFVAIGQTLVILGRSLDLSVGYVVALTSLVAGTTMAGESGRLGLGIAAALGVAAAIGLANGIVVTYLKVNPFIATVGMGLMLKGFIDVYYSAQEGAVPEGYKQFGYYRIGPLPVSTLVMLVFGALILVLLIKTRFGAHLFAVGGSDDVARLSGVRTHRTLIIAHVVCSVAAGIAGLLIAARFGLGSAQVYNDGLDLDSVAAVVLGGTLLMGGRGSIGGTVAGVMILSVLSSAFNVLDVNPFLKNVIRGVIIILAVALYARRQIDPLSRRARFNARGERRAAEIVDHPVADPLATTGPGGNR